MQREKIQKEQAVMSKIRKDRQRQFKTEIIVKSTAFRPIKYTSEEQMKNEVQSEDSRLKKQQRQDRDNGLSLLH